MGERRRRLRDYAQVEEDHALSSESPSSRSTYIGLSYGKAMLLMEALELRIGKEAVTAFLRALIERHRGAHAGWAELVQLLGELQGPEVGGWFGEWVDRPGAPALELEGARAADGSFHGAIVQVNHRGHPTGEPPFRGTVQVGVQKKGEEANQLHAIELSGMRTEVRLPLPEGAALVVLDPLIRFPRQLRIRGEGSDDDERSAQTSVELAPAAPPK